MGSLNNMSAPAGELMSAGIGFLGNLGGSVAGGLFSANQAKKNRAFQERMYNKQYQDSIDFWKMQNEYNLPSAQLERLRQANLNPLLMYGEGGISGNLAQQAPQLPQQPHGAQGQVSSFNTKIDLANLALVEAQANDLNASAELKRNDAAKKRNENVSVILQNQITERTMDAVVALSNKNVEKASQEIEWLATQDYCLTNMTAASINNLASMVEYREKYYDIDYQRMANDAWYQIEQIALGKAHVANELKQIAVQWYNAVTDRKDVVAKIAVYAEEVKKIQADTALTEQEKSNKILDAYNQVLKNEMLENIGTDNLGGAAGLLLMLTGKTFGRIE